MTNKAVALYGTLLPPARRAALQDAGLLALRLGASALMAVHGWDKLVHFSEKAGQFPDPIGVGPTLSLGLATFAELFCSVLVAAGLATRLALTQLVVTMFVATFLVMGGDVTGKGELPALYLVVYVALILTGPGRLSADHAIAKKLGAA